MRFTSLLSSLASPAGAGGAVGFLYGAAVTALARVALDTDGLGSC